jgi:hypothetical protein
LCGTLHVRRAIALNRGLIDSITETKLVQGVSNTTINRTLELVRAILRRSVDRVGVVGACA